MADGEASAETAGTIDAKPWSESTDLEIVNWKRVRLAIEHENTLTNSRFTWLLSSQAALLAGYVYIFGTLLANKQLPAMMQTAHPVQSDAFIVQPLEGRLLLGAIAILGVFTSLYFCLGIREAYKQHAHLKKWWDAKHGPWPEKEEDWPDERIARHPRICGNEPRFVGVFLHYFYFPLLLWCFWLGLAIFGAWPFAEHYGYSWLRQWLETHGEPIAEFAGAHILEITFVIFSGIAFGFGALWGARRDTRNKDRSKGP